MTLLGEQIIDGGDYVAVPVGEVRERYRHQVEVAPGQEYTRRLVTVGDLSDAHGPARDEFNRYIDELNAWAAENKNVWQVPTQENGFQTNPARSMFYSRFPGSQTMMNWQKDILKARALYPLQKPHDALRVLPDGVDDYSMDVFMFAKDSIGIRSRAVVMKQSAFMAAQDMPGNEVAILSLGSGAAVPTIDAASSIRDQLHKTVKMDLCDIDAESLQLASELMQDARIPAGDVDMYVGHFIRKLDAMKKRNARVDIVEALGLFEYLKPRDATNLIKDAYELTKPGGVVIVSNMLSDRPQLEFNQFAVGWPYVVPRTENQLIGLAANAGLDPREMTLTVPEDGVYGVLEIRKPW